MDCRYWYFIYLVIEKVDEEKNEDIKPEENGVKVKGYKDFNQLQAEMKQRDKELKKKRKAKRRSEIDDSENGSRTGSNQLEQNNNQKSDKSYSPTGEEHTDADPTGNPDLGIVLNIVPILKGSQFYVFFG